MPNCKDQRFARLPMRASNTERITELDRANATIFDFNIFKARVEMDMPAKSDNLGADLTQHKYEFVCADVRLCKCDDAFVNAKVHHIFEYCFAEQVATAGVELAIAECACSTFTK